MTNDTPDRERFDYDPRGYWITLLFTLGFFVLFVLFIGICWWMAQAGQT